MSAELLETFRGFK